VRRGEYTIKPRVIIHNAISLDGRIEGFPVDMGAYYQLAAQFFEDATLVGSQTLVEAHIASQLPANEPTRGESDAPGWLDPLPLLVAVDSRGRVKDLHLWRKTPYWREVVCLCSKSTPEGHLAYLHDHQIEAIIAGEERVDLSQALEELNSQYGVKTVRVDSGGILSAVLLQQDLVDQVSLLLHPVLVSGKSRLIYQPGEAGLPALTISLKLTDVEELGNDLLYVNYKVLPEARQDP
jgi:2,5-diamino-6-(ribosylamino)-4(3H)-pyrimidinone 5'-phosphate reductase